MGHSALLLSITLLCTGEGYQGRHLSVRLQQLTGVALSLCQWFWHGWWAPMTGHNMVCRLFAPPCGYMVPVVRVIQVGLFI